MIAISCLLFFVGFHVLYNTSRRAKLNPPFLYEGWARHNVAAAKLSGLLLLIFAFITMCVAQGLGAGIFFGIVALMTAGSLVVLLAPLGRMYLGIVAGVCLFILLLELLTAYIYAS